MPEIELIWLIATATGIGFLHTLAGPDHYAPLAAMSLARKWTTAKTLFLTLICGTGHLTGSIVLGALGVWFGYALGGLEAIESARGDLAAWALLCFGLAYGAWGLRRVFRNKPHAHWHAHPGLVHAHAHTHHAAHVHVHDPIEIGAPDTLQTTFKLSPLLIPWTIFIVFVLGPCEALIPLLMYPAASHGSALGISAVVAAFGLTTLLTMTIMTFLTRYGLSKVKLPNLARYSHALVGAGISACGASMVFLGL